MDMMDIIKLSQEWHLGPQLGSGGFGRIYAAQSEAGEEAVVKLVPKEPGASRELLFEELSGVPNVIPIRDSGEWNDFWVLVMPRAEKSLRQYLAESDGSLALEETIVVLTDVATALVAIDGHVVHRDLKPENILFLNGRWCLADFGIARYAEATTSSDTRKFAMTQQYAAPEQWRSERATSATDVYATGIIAFEMLSGRTPFLGPSVEDFRYQHLEEMPPALPEVPASLGSLISQCLYKAPGARPTPQNLLDRLGVADQPTSDAAGRLQQAHQIAVQKEAGVARETSQAQSEAERRESLFRVAEESLSRISEALHAKVIRAAPGSDPTGVARWPCILNEAELSLSDARPRGAEPRGKSFLPFDIIAYSQITVQIPPDHWEYEGRSHSLWYCDAQEPGVFRWYETAFMIHAFIPRRGRLNPFALDPSEDSLGALSPVMTEYQAAWPFTPIDQGNETEFIERWLGWFADAANGKLRQPSRMPERDPKGSWRIE